MSEDLTATLHDLLVTGLRHHELGEVEQARDAYLKILELDPRNAQALDLAGVLCMQCGELEAARDFYDAALEVEPENARFLTHVGTLQLHQGDLSEAVDTFRIAAENDPTYAEPIFFLALVLRGIGQRLDAVDNLDEALAQDPDNSLFLSWRGTLAWETGDFEAAIDYLERSLQSDETNLEAMSQLGSVLVDLEDFAMAERCFRAALDIAPGDPMSRGKLADALSRQGRREEAGREFKVALETSSDNARLWALYSVMLAGEGNGDGAAEAADKARTIDPGSIDVELALLETFNLLGAADSIASSKARLRELAPDDARVDAATA
jgi:tetratricopeptide (TPR) repeat protein